MVTLKHHFNQPCTIIIVPKGEIKTYSFQPFLLYLIANEGRFVMLCIEFSLENM